MTLSEHPARPRVLSGGEICPGVVDRVVARAAEPPEALEDALRETLYAEGARLARAGASPRNEVDRAFLSQLMAAFARGHAARRELVTSVVERYAAEIGGHFDPRVYTLATRLLPRGLGLLLHGAGRSSLLDAVGNIDDRVRFEGEVAALRRAVSLGTVILVPTHVSNLDSPLLGWVIYRLGLPPFAYAAGLNLFGSSVVGFFMRNVGAYTVDRTKTDPLYKATLKEYTTTLAASGQHLLFFPGGTRSRSGALERHLKLGLLGTLPTAFRRALASGRARPRIFVVPVTLSYPLVLEAKSLVGDWLRAEGGKETVGLTDEYSRPERWVEFVRHLRTLDLAVTLRFARPLDAIGNEVDDTGLSHDGRGHAVDPAGYFTEHGALTDDPARDAEYTRGLATRIVASYQASNEVMPTSLVAFAIFERLRRNHADTDIFRTLRAMGPCREVLEADVEADLARLLIAVRALAERGRICLSREIERATAPATLQAALASFATYHASPVLERACSSERASDDAPRIRVGDPTLLFYYRNRLDGYGLEAAGPSASERAS